MLRLGNCVLDLSHGSLRDSQGAEVQLRPKSLDLLLTLARNSGRIMSRDELFDAVWPDVTVTEDSIAQCVRDVRRAIGDREGRVLRTVVKRGYCLDINVQSAASTATPGHAPTIGTEHERPSLVVLPFQSIPYDASMEWFADGIVEEINTALSRFRFLFVIARSSAFNLKGESLDVREIGRRLGARYVLEGSIQKAGEQLRITGQLVETETGSHLWADRFDGVMTDVFELQDRVATTIAGVMEHRIRRVETDRATRKPTTDLTAYDLYLRALTGFFARTQAGYEFGQAAPGRGDRSRSRLCPGAQHGRAACRGRRPQRVGGRRRLGQRARDHPCPRDAGLGLRAILWSWRAAATCLRFSAACTWRERRWLTGRSQPIRTAPRHTFAEDGCRYGTVTLRWRSIGRTCANDSIRLRRSPWAEWNYEQPGFSLCVGSTRRSTQLDGRSAERRIITWLAPTWSLRSRIGGVSQKRLPRRTNSSSIAPDGRWRGRGTATFSAMTG